MCLYDEKRFRFTFKRIPVYKIVKYYGKGCKQNDVYLTPYQHAIVKKQMSGFDSFISALKRFTEYLHTDYKYLRYYKSFLFELKIILFGSKLQTFPEYAFGEGFIHAFKNKKSTQKVLNESKYRYKYITIIEGYIPAFTRYQIGNDDICARRMIFPNI